MEHWLLDHGPHRIKRSGDFEHVDVVSVLPAIREQDAPTPLIGRDFRSRPCFTTIWNASVQADVGPAVIGKPGVVPD
jgi:hypothetical protein